MNRTAPINPRATYEFSSPHDALATGAPREARPARDLLKSVELRAVHFVDDGMEPKEAEQKAVEEFLERLEKDAEGEARKYNIETEELRQRLEMIRKPTPEAAPWLQQRLKELRARLEEGVSKLKSALEDFFQPSIPQEKEPYRRMEIEDVCEQHLETWIREGYLAKLVEVTSSSGIKMEIPQSQRMVELIALVRSERDKIRTLTDEEADAKAYEALRAAELELLEYEAGVGELEARIDLDAFLAQPLVDIHEQLQNGVRHPRMKQYAFWKQRSDYASRRDKKEKGGDPWLGYRSGFTEDSVANAHFSERENDLRQTHSTLQNGWSPRFPQPVRDRFVVAAHQIENRAFARASQTLSEAVQLLPKTDKALPRLTEMKNAIEKQTTNPVEETARASAELYRRVLAEEPEREQEIRLREELEGALRTGEILSWRSVKTVKGEGSDSLTEDQIKGNDKVFELHIARAGKPPLKAFAKSAHTEGYFRDTIPPEQTVLMEWEAAQEAFLLGADVVPPTVIRSFPFGEMSVQLFATDMDESGNTKDSVNPKMIEGWEKQLSNQNREEIALFQLLTAAQDAGEPNHVLTQKDPGLFTARSIDNGLSNGNGRAALVSCLLAASSGRELSAATREKLARYEQRLPLVEAVLKKVVLYDTEPLIKRKRNIVQGLLRTGRFADYEKNYGGVWGDGDKVSLLRDHGWFAKQYRKTEKKDDEQKEAVNA